MGRARAATCVLLLATATSAGTARADVVVGEGGGHSATKRSFVRVGHEPLFGRGMNAAPAVYRNYVYVGNRTDASGVCENGQPQGCEHRRPGILIVDARDPSDPDVVGEIGAPHAAQVGVTTRELRVWPREKLLIVMTFRCSNQIHACPPGSDTTFPFELKFFSLENPRRPRYLSGYVPTSRAGRQLKPHEMHLWVDPQRPRRALLYLSLTRTERDPSIPNLLVVDISSVSRGGAVRHVTEANFNDRYEPVVHDPANLYLHSMGVSADGRRTHLAQIAGTHLEVDSSDVAANRANPQLRLLTDPRNRVRWANPNGHSAFDVPGRPFVVTTDELYGTFTDPLFGCPWGWLRTIDVSDPARPRMVGAFKLRQNTRAFCDTAAGRNDAFVSYTAHNPTLLPELAFVTWHSGGLQAIDLSNPAHPRQAGWYTPTPIEVPLLDPALGRGPGRSIMWSFPIIRDGLIYVVDIRNGLYILRYTGRHRREVERVRFLEGNSNLGDAVRLAQRPR
jgi:hypothetical protein